MAFSDSILDFFISSAHADTTQVAASAAPQSSGGFSLIIMLGIFVAFMYFTVWRPQSRRAKEHKNLINTLTKGDEVITAGGMLGRVVKVSDNYIVISLAEGMDVTMQKSSIVAALPKGTIKAI